MKFSDYFYCIIMHFLALYLKKTASLSNKDLNVVNLGLETITPCSVGMIFYTIVNNTSPEVDYDVEIKPDQCCLMTDSKDVCNVIRIEGECIDAIPKGASKTLRFVAPLVEPFERRGYCIVYLDSRSVARQRKTMRDKIKLTFDSRLKNPKQPKELVDKAIICTEADQDPFNSCRPVDCETFYNGKRSFFNNKTKRCVNVPLCISDSRKEMPTTIYDKNKNKCIVGESVSKEDVNLIKRLTKNTGNRKPKEVIILTNYVTAKPIKSYTDIDIPDKLMNFKQTEPDYVLKFDKSKFKALKMGYKCVFRKYILENKWTLTVLAGVIVVQCFLICTMIYFLTRSCRDCTKKKVVRKFFNYRQDASVTTPLICTSNIDTDTTEFQYYSETSNVDKMIKCYKACQKERKTHAKMSMSDDILSKCLTRRDWKSKPARSEAIAESSPTEDELKKTSGIEPPSSILYETNINDYNKKHGNAKVNFETEQDKKQKREKKPDKQSKPTANRNDNKSKRTDKDYDEMQYDVSEKELNCHCYRYSNNEPNLTGYKSSNHSKKQGFFESDKHKVGNVSLSTEKSAQAAFSYDSLDDYVSERGLMFRAGEDLSKYSFSSHSNNVKGSSLSSEISSKTSKNNVVKNVLSLLHRKTSHGPSSHPGAKKKDSNTNVELIHMSKASVYSSYNGSEYLKNLKQTKDSRTSL